MRPRSSSGCCRCRSSPQRPTRSRWRVAGKTLTALGSYWKGRKPLILAKACILGCLLPATDDPARDLEIFEKLMAMDDESFVVRWKRRPKPKEILATLSIARIDDYFTVEPDGVLPAFCASGLVEPGIRRVRSLGARTSPSWSAAAWKRKCCQRCLTASAWTQAQAARGGHGHCPRSHLGRGQRSPGTSAHSFPELVEQLGIMRFGHRPRVADTFCGSGQIPFEAARLGCDVYASDLNPVACMLTWGAFNIVGGSEQNSENLAKDQQELVQRVQAEIDQLGVETDGNGWRAKVFLYCVEVRCPQSGWMVPLIPSFVISQPENRGEN